MLPDKPSAVITLETSLCLYLLQSPGSSRGSGPLRVCQLRVEEGMDVVNREAAHERTVQSTLQITDSLSQSCEDITLVSGNNKSFLVLLSLFMSQC